jgi:hypothetical protein
MHRRESLTVMFSSLLSLCGAGTAAAQGAAGTAKKPPAAPAPAIAFELITGAEALRDREARPKNGEAADLPEIRTRSLPSDKPVFAIRVIAPTPQATVRAPLRIELAFDTRPGQRIVPSSFRVLYGVLKIDLTERLRRFATISEQGVVVDQAVVPDGLHRLFVQVADDKGNIAEQELRLRVGVAS